MALNLNHFKNTIHNELSLTEKQILKNMDKLRALKINAGGERDLQDCNIERSRLNSENGLLAARKKRQLNALKKLAEGEYGYCDSCGDELSVDALTNNPAASDCANCS